MTHDRNPTSAASRIARVAPGRARRERAVASISMASPSILGYHHDLDESFIRLLNDTQRLGQREVEEF
jgi:hypothetical protein